jgi:hypothetical protein
MDFPKLKNKEDCIACLKGLEIVFKLIEHEPVMNMEELSKIKLEKAPYVKNLFFTEKKPNSYYMIIADNNTKIEKGK